MSSSRFRASIDAFRLSPAPSAQRFKYSRVAQRRIDGCSALEDQRRLGRACARICARVEYEYELRTFSGRRDAHPWALGRAERHAPGRLATGRKPSGTAVARPAQTSASTNPLETPPRKDNTHAPPRAADAKRKQVAD
ncbi:hypothetical protein HETIRDRAFT_453511 [Heterobasidion irregulare TC 32-1]|uniref:Uncharacterized protein n=1 Tax=Heterobasidion irregulare (strain TC 32-1) TaxID=747525 RepID=W4JZS5_HETIT|nr:uncharacterized protein HETIRDRAFT_453511 [Heterobasidion irregulare TC 32-1]ETW78979.1 hypothetical protein HETIRDRAFT_453511 [Heterobasidion irregulare TC 32-1]